MHQQTVQAVIFDMDGLMFDTEHIGFASYQQAAAELGKEVSLALYKKTLGHNKEEIRQVYLEHFQDVQFVNALRKREKELARQSLAQHVPVKRGLYELLHFLQVEKIPAAVASSSPRVEVEELVQRANVRDFFQVLCTGDDVQRAKPDPEIFLQAAKLLKVSPSHALVLEDSRNGLLAAKAAKIPAIMVPDMIEANAEMRSLAVTVVRDLTEVIPYIQAHK